MHCKLTGNREAAVESRRRAVVGMGIEGEVYTLDHQFHIELGFAEKSYRIRKEF